MVFIAAELGVNWRSLTEAKRMIGLAQAAGADGVKFQIFKSEHVEGHPRYHELEEIILSREKIKYLKQAADSCGIEFFATPTFPEAVDWLENVGGINRYKIRYADNDNESLISRVIQTGKEIFLSGDNVYNRNLLYDHKPRLVWLNRSRFHYIYCIPEYPPKTVDLPVDFRESNFSGYSNHYPSISVPLAAIARGVKYLEVHVKNDKYPDGYRPIDDAVSITFSDLEELVRLTREIEKVII